MAADEFAQVRRGDPPTQEAPHAVEAITAAARHVRTSYGPAVGAEFARAALRPWNLTGEQDRVLRCQTAALYCLDMARGAREDGAPLLMQSWLNVALAWADSAELERHVAAGSATLADDLEDPPPSRDW